MSNKFFLVNAYRIPPNSSRIIFDESGGIAPKGYKNHVVCNIGRTEVDAQTIYGTAFGWINGVASAIVGPNETKTIDNGRRPYYRVGLKIYNKTNIPAIVSAEYADGSLPRGKYEAPHRDIDYNKIIKKLVVVGVKFVPYVGPTLSGLLNAFWPEGQPNIWEQIHARVQNLVDNSIRDAVSAILNGDIRHYQERIKVLDSQIGMTRDTSNYYMNLAQDLVGFELKFTYPEDKYTAFVLLPMYTAVVMMKMNYYITGISKAAELGISDRDVQHVKNFARRLIEGQNGAISYINRMYKEKIDSVYDTCDVKDIYDSMMNTRSYIAVNGLAYIPMWKQMLVDSSSAEDAYVDTVTYSEFFGRATCKLYEQATPEILTVPLTPKLINGRRNKMIAVKLYMWRAKKGAGDPKIGGLEVFFENGESYKMGEDSNETHYHDFGGAYLKKLYVQGYAINSITFFLSNGRIDSYGTYNPRMDRETFFELKDHHIASIFLANDDTERLEGQAANIAVSYLQN